MGQAPSKFAWPCIALFVAALEGVAVGVSMLIAPKTTAHELLNSAMVVRASAISLATSVATMMGFAALDATCTNDAWAWLGEMRTQQPSTTETGRKGKFLLHLCNAQSSVAHITAGCFVLCHVLGVGQRDTLQCRAPVASVALGISLSLMGIASYGWWGSRRALAWRWDHIMMEVLF